VPTGRPKNSRDKRRRSISPQSLANLRRPWRKGESGNVHGRPQSSLSEQACRLLTPQKRLKILKAVLAKAERGDTTAALCLARLERYYGKEIREAARESRRRLPGDFAAGTTRTLPPAANMDEVFDAARKAAADAAAEPPEVSETETP
jgi:hypothetical protein